MKFKIILATIAFLTILLMASCNQKINTGGPSINTGITQQSLSVEDIAPNPPPASISLKTTDIADLLEQGSEYISREVIIQGKIVQECGSGCWFNLRDDTGIIYVDLAPSNLVIPQKVGSQAKVYGKVEIKKGITYIIGTKVEF